MNLQKFLTTPNSNKFSNQMIFWFTLSITFAAIYGIEALQQSFSSKYIIPDDARSHVFWMRRFLDPELFPNDLIANYFQSISPPGYAAFYQIIAKIGIDPVLLNKFIPLILGLITTAYCFGICVQILPVPTGGFIGSLLLNQSLWLDSTLPSGIAKAFLYPLFTAFIYYLLRRSLIGVCLTIGLLGLFYAPLMLVTLGILALRLLNWNGWLIRFSSSRNDYLIFALGIGVALCAILPLIFQSSEFGPLITVSEAKTLPEFLPGGRVSFFNDEHPWKYWLQGSRSGIRLFLNPPLVAFGLLLPLLLRFSVWFPLVKFIKSDVVLLLQIPLSSLILFFAAHALLFKLFLPSRYTIHSLRITIAIAAAIVSVLLLDKVFSICGKQVFISLLITILVAILLIFYPQLFWGKTFPYTTNIVGSQPEIYEFFLAQPQDSLIASLSLETDNLPTFAQRPVLVSREYALPYHVGYYRKIRQRATDLILAQYSPDLKVVQKFIQTYAVDFFLLDNQTFTPEYVSNNFWFKQWQPLKKEILESLNSGRQPAMIKTVKQCSVFKNDSLTIVNVDCIMNYKH